MSFQKSPEYIMPVFIVGTQRSGTSLLQSLIDSNSEIYFPRFEMKLFVRFYHRLKDYEPFSEANLQRFLYDYGKYRIRKAGSIDNSRLLRLIDKEKVSWARIYDEIMSQLALVEDKSRWGDKSPGNEYYTDQILGFYPRAKIICTIRDPLAVVASSRRRYDRGIIRPVVRWKLSLSKIIDSYLKLSADSFLIVFYEDLVLDMEGTMKRVFDFIGIKPNRSLEALEINSEKWGHGGVTSYKTKENIKKGVIWDHPLSAYREELSPNEIKIIEILTRNERQIAGYCGSFNGKKNYYQDFVENLNTVKNIPKYHVLLSRVLNRITDRHLKAP